MLKERGFTLLEVLLATLITAVGVTALIWAFSSGLSATADVENMDLALNIAQAGMEMVKNQSFLAIDTDAEIQALVSTLSDATFTVRSTNFSTQVANQRIRVGVKVTWDVKGGSGSTSITLTTLVTNY